MKEYLRQEFSDVLSCQAHQQGKGGHTWGRNLATYWPVKRTNSSTQRR